MAEKFIYYMHGLTKVHPPRKEVLKDISLSFYYGAKIGIIGVNGSGKSTLLKIMAGLDSEFQGEAWIEKGRTVGYLSQEPQLDETLDVKGNVELAVKGTRDLLEQFEEISAQFAEPMDDSEMDKLMAKQAEIQDKIEAVDAWDLDRQLEIAMDALRLPPGDADVKNLSGGEKRRVALCKLLLQKPDLLLLDEPTNHLDAESVAWLERHLKEYAGSVILVTHDRYFLDNVVEWILELDRGRGIPWKGNYASWLEQRTERMQKEEKEESVRQRRLKNELQWVQMSQKARQSKGKARLNAYEELRSLEIPEKVNTASIVIPHGPRLGNVVIDAKELTKAYGDKLLFENLTFSLPRAGIVGIIGANGSGKTTLLNIITSREKPDSGSITVGETVELSYVDQVRDALNGENTVYEEITGGKDTLNLGKIEVNSRAYVGKFNFSGSDQQKQVKQLSGGERNRVHLAKMLQSGGNVLLLDEPTNDLDVETLQALEQAISDFSGCAVIVTHDRWFLDRIATHILAFEGDSTVVWHEGNYDSYETKKRERLGIGAEQPHRIKYKPLQR
ncbi:energy-dependent translational throttle protein EttA [Chitinispirillales bacterium ANBcel5]|uniref:energy-dependent translational throttle protein EttA n=1 Tax=Cellulosispirillum alkaliphilum TaxID=3039283 RepID=UPI002A55A19A|nr:energy-dependent translational throttle protein EttA [Chitinispirillales bacterium ANBcel5]